MRNLVLVAAVLASACGGMDVPLDPVGTWTMTGTFVSGSCNVGGTTFSENITVVELDGDYGASTGQPGDTATGGFESTASLATMNLSIVNNDVNNDGGSLHGVTNLTATADDGGQISGNGNVSLSGSKSCGETFSLAGTLTP